MTRIQFVCSIVILVIAAQGYAQVDESNKMDYRVIAEGTDSPISNLQTVCFNKYFNEAVLPEEFIRRYNLDIKSLYKKQMLIEIFKTVPDSSGIDKIEVVDVIDDGGTIIVSYNLLNSDSSNDEQHLAPFIIIQVPKLRKRGFKFIEDGVELAQPAKLFVN